MMKPAKSYAKAAIWKACSMIYRLQIRAARTVRFGYGRMDFCRTCKVNKNSLSRSDFFAMMIRGKEDMKNDLTVDCTIFPLETVRIYVETIMGISKKPISLEVLLDLIRFLLDFGKAERGKITGPSL